MPRAPKLHSSNASRKDVSHFCRFCTKGFTSGSSVRLHIANKAECRKRWEMEIASYHRHDRVPSEPIYPAPEPSTVLTHLSNVDNLPPPPTSLDDVPMVDQYPEVIPNEQMDPTLSGAVTTQPETLQDANVTSPQLFTRYVEEYPRVEPETFGDGLTTFEHWRKNGLDGDSRWAPFESEDEWDLVEWMGKNLGHNQIEDFLKLRTIQNCDLSMGSKYTFFQKLDGLPASQNWMYDDVTIVGDRIGEDSKMMTERVELWRRDPVECIRELMGNPAFRDAMAYAPSKVFADMGHNIRVYDEMSTGQWWWNKQTELPAEATIAPVILASDKTQLSQFRGDQTAWPVYLSIGNIAKETRRKVSARATILIGYIPVSKLECFKKGPGRSVAGYRLFHHCMRTILEPLIDAGRKGVLMIPSRAVSGNVKENWCPRGQVTCKERGELTECVLRQVDATLDLLNKHKAEKIDDEELDAKGLRPVYEPFWKDLPHCNIYETISPDILHQLHKGVFKDHLMSWITAIVGKEEIDRRFMAMAQMPGLRFFKNGISGVSQWTGAEHKEMQKVVVGLLAGACSGEVLACVQALVDFIYLAQLQVHTDVTLRLLREALEAFHANKEVFVRLGVRKHFNIPKLHSLLHYIESIIQRGTLDGLNTELSERLHIDFAKEAYRAGNHRDYIAHMTTWLLRQEKLHLRAAYLCWLAQQEHDEAVALQKVCEDASSSRTPLQVVSESGLEIDSDFRVNTAPSESTQAGDYIKSHGGQWVSSDLRPTSTESDVASATVFVDPLADDMDDDDEHGDWELREDPTDARPRAGTVLPQGERTVVTHYRDVSNVRQFILAKRCAFERQPVDVLIDKHQAPQFHWAFLDFVRNNFESVLYRPTRFSTYSCYRQVKILRPWNPYTGNKFTYDRIRAIPAVPEKGRKKAVPAAFDTVLVIEDSQLVADAPAGSLRGIRAARLRVIFNLPPQFLLPGYAQKTLAYVEWYTPFTRVDDATGMYYVSRSTRNKQPNVSIVNIEDIVGPCHLIPRFSTKIDRTWSSEHILDVATHFFVNPYISIDAYTTSGLYCRT
ncbi:hypothetical protein K474DRAFT_1743277 [Panus rudis PR-1116 ss-1]|nr:hypothetical protein K474DRAFT_1743277 [Panus rudis PR-1116 ss-1]